MNGNLKKLLCALACCSVVISVSAEELNLNKRIPMMNRGASTFYVEGHIDGFGPAFMLVDTGSSYSTVNEETFAILEKTGHTSFVKELQGTMADGSRRLVPIYRISGVNLGGECYVRDVEVALFPGSTRLILGLSVLRKVSPFMFSIGKTPHILLSNCQHSSEENLSKDSHTDLLPAKTTQTVMR
jgi:predicted aspartyl protease